MTPLSPIRLVIVDDHPIVRDGLRGMVRDHPHIDVVGEAGDGSQAVRVAQATDPDVILMDLQMPHVDGVSAIRRLRELGNRARVVVLTTYGSETMVLPALEAGATGYLLKDATSEDLIHAVEVASRGEAMLSPSVATQLIARVRAPDSPLSDRELEVLRLIAAGRGNRATAGELFISETTVKTHLLHIYAKLGVKDRAAAVAAAYQRGLLE